MSRLSIAIVVLLWLPAGCTNVYEGDFKLPGVYRISIQQGNVINQEMLDKLKPGMNHNQVRFIMGTPILLDPFHSERWDYVYTYSRAGTQREQRRISLYFEEGKLASVDGDVVTGLARSPAAFLNERKSVAVPPRKTRRPGIIARLLSALPFVGDDDALPGRQKQVEPRPPEITDPAGVGQGEDESL